MRFFHETIIKVPTSKKIDSRAFHSIFPSLLNKINGRTGYNFDTDSFRVGDLEDLHLKGYLTDLFKTHYPGIPTNTLRVVHTFGTEMMRFSELKNTLTANLVLSATSGAKMIGMNYRHLSEFVSSNEPDSVTLRQGKMFLMEADCWHYISNPNRNLMMPGSAVYILQADLDYSDPKHDAVTSRRKHQLINEVLRVAKNGDIPPPSTSTVARHHEHELWNKEKHKDYRPAVDTISPSPVGESAESFRERVFGSFDCQYGEELEHS